MGTSIESGGVTVVPKSTVPQTAKGVEAPELKLPDGELQKLGEMGRAVEKELEKLKKDGWDDKRPAAPPPAPRERPSTVQQLQDAAGNLGKVGEGDCAPKVKGELGKDKVKGEMKVPLGCPPKPLE